MKFELPDFIMNWLRRRWNKGYNRKQFTRCRLHIKLTINSIALSDLSKIAAIPKTIYTIRMNIRYFRSLYQRHCKSFGFIASPSLSLRIHLLFKSLTKKRSKLYCGIVFLMNMRIYILSFLCVEHKKILNERKSEQRKFSSDYKMRERNWEIISLKVYAEKCFHYIDLGYV